MAKKKLNATRLEHSKSCVLPWGNLGGRCCTHRDLSGSGQAFTGQCGSVWAVSVYGALTPLLWTTEMPGNSAARINAASALSVPPPTVIWWDAGRLLLPPASTTALLSELPKGLGKYATLSLFGNLCIKQPVQDFTPICHLAKEHFILQKLSQTS